MKISLYPVEKGINFILVISVVGALFVATISYAGATYYQANKLVKEGDSLVNSGNYSEAIIKYKLSQSKWKFNKAINHKIEETTILASDDLNYKQGETNLTNDDWQAAPATNLSDYSQITDIKIIGDNNCRNLTYAALNLLNNKDQVALNIIKSYIGTIECIESGSGIFAWEQPPRYAVGSATFSAGTIWYAGTIVHESCHSKLYNDYLTDNKTSSVPADIWTGENAESKCLNEQYDALSLIGADSSTLDYVKNVLSTQYWKVPYNERWW